MKTKLILMLAAVVAISAGSFQNVNAQTYWSLDGNSNATTSSKLGTTNLIPLRIITNNQERIRVGTDGRVGIGTIAPSSLLSVVKSAGGPSTADFRNTSIGPNISWVHFGSTGDWYIRSAATNGKVILQDQSPTGRVGIGTASPGSFFSVVRSSGASAGLATADFRSPGLGSNISWIHFGPKGDWQIRSAANDGNVVLQDQSASARVGIGTTTPARKLEVRDGDIRIKTTNSTARFLEFQDDAPGHIDYRLRPYSLDVGNGVEFPHYALQIESSNNSFSSNAVLIAEFRAREYSSTVMAANGSIRATGYLVSSDARLKKDIQSFERALDVVKQLQPKTYLFKKEQYSNLNLPEEKQYGFLAQEIEKVLPELVATSKEQVSTDVNGNSKFEELKTVNYTELIPILTKAIQEQQEQIEELKHQITSLAGLKALEKIDNGSTKLAHVTLQQASIDQNIPNPLSASTTIPYTIPADAKKAIVYIRDINGNIIKQVPLSIGSGELVIDASTLNNGIYTYSLIVDGNLVETKKMIVVK